MGEVLGETSLVREEKKKEEKERGDVTAELLFTEGRQPRWHPTMLQGRQWVPATLAPFCPCGTTLQVQVDP
jgi:hypothetical protein